MKVEVLDISRLPERQRRLVRTMVRELLRIAPQTPAEAEAMTESERQAEARITKKFGLVPVR